MAHVHWIGVLVASVVAMVIGFTWYSPALFAKPWSKLTGIDCSGKEGGKKKGMGRVLAVAFILNVMTATAIDFIIRRMGIWTLDGALKLGFLLWIGFVAPAMLSAVLWEKKPFALYLINVFHCLVVLEAMSAILLIS